MFSTEFKIGENYRYIGCAIDNPSLHYFEHDSVMMELEATTDTDTYITDNGNMYRYVQGIVTFKYGSDYKLRTVSPMIFEGDAYLIGNNVSSKLLRLYELYRELFVQSNIEVNADLLYLFVESTHELVFGHRINTTTELKERLKEVIINCFSAPSSSETLRDVIIATLFPGMGCAIRRISDLAFSIDLSIKWDCGEPPVLIMNNGMEFWKWYSLQLRPAKRGVTYNDN